ncbi:hypothetical protein KAR91_13800 [Candidatus Pacearchaeota archaeon]|nr:hypothetical protein [Candidatus Pacearchaeota archaeon]
MKLQTKPPKKGDNTKGDLIRYFDNNWLTQSDLLDTPEAIEGGLSKDVIRLRLKSKKIDTLEKLLAPKRGYVLTKKSDSKEFKDCPDDLIEKMESGSNHVLLNGKSKTVKIRGSFSIPGAHNKPLIIKEFLIDKEKYRQVKDKEHFLKQKFIHAISAELVVECVVEV